MKACNATGYVVGVTAAVIIFAGCSAAQSPLSPSGPTQPSAAHSGFGAQQLDRDRSWMAPDAPDGDLLYVSDVGQPQVVYVYSYGPGRLVGTLTGFTQPLGLCVDGAGDVFVPDASSQIFEYAHGGTTPIKTLSDPSGVPDGCSVDPATGDLAVANGSGLRGAPGNLLVYADASGTPAEYTDSKFSALNFPGYDDRGRLFVDGMNNTNNGFILAELAHGGSTLANIALNRRIGFPGDVQWDGKYLAVGDQSTNEIYQFTIEGSRGTQKGTTSLHGASDVVQFWIAKLGGGKVNPRGTRVVGADFGGESFGGQVLYWNYPAGGNPKKAITRNLQSPYGVTVSKAVLTESRAQLESLGP
jgi:hypothetical protein